MSSLVSPRDWLKELDDAWKEEMIAGGSNPQLPHHSHIGLLIDTKVMGGSFRHLIVDGVERSSTILWIFRSDREEYLTEIGS
jgi:hypothetical protein